MARVHPHVRQLLQVAARLKDGDGEGRVDEVDVARQQPLAHRLDPLHDGPACDEGGRGRGRGGCGARVERENCQSLLHTGGSTAGQRAQSLPALCRLAACCASWQRPAEATASALLPPGSLALLLQELLVGARKATVLVRVGVVDLHDQHTFASG